MCGNVTFTEDRGIKKFCIGCISEAVFMEVTSHTKPSGIKGVCEVPASLTVNVHQAYNIVI